MRFGRSNPRLATQAHRLEKKVMSISREITITHTEHDGSTYKVVYGFDDVNGRLEVSRVSVEATKPNTIVTQKVLRSLSPLEATRRVRNSMLTGSGKDHAPLLEKWVNSEEQLTTVARLYREAYASGESIDRYIAKRIDRPLSTVNRWIRYARNSGHLGAPKNTRGGEVVSQ
jgi:hypothetical protein